MDDEVPAIHSGCEGKQIEEVHDLIVDGLVVLGQALIDRAVHSSLKLKVEVIILDSWFPLSRWIDCGYFSL